MVINQKPNVISYKDIQYHKNDMGPSTMLGKTTVIAGVSKSGKSFALNDILKGLSKSLRALVVFSGTANVDKSFPMTGYTHPSMIHNTLNIPALEKVIDKAAEMMEKYQRYTTLRMVEPVAIYLRSKLKRYQTSSINTQWATVTKEKEDFKNLVSPTKDVIDERSDKLTMLFRKIIVSYKRIILKKGILLNNEIAIKVVEFVDFNVNVGVVINDLTDEYDALTKKEKGIVNQIFNKGRHFGITMIMLIHTWNGFGTTLRNSANNIIFTSPDLANSYVSGQKMRHMEARQFTDALNAIITKDRALPLDQRKYYCMLFIKDSLTFSYVQADPRGKQVYVGIRYFDLRPRKHKNS